MAELRKRATEGLRSDFQKRSWEDLFPDPSDTAEKRVEKREKLEHLLKVKRIELSKLLRETDQGRKGDDVVAETPTTQRGGQGVIGEESNGGDCVRTTVTPRDLDFEGTSSRRTSLRRKSSLGGDKDRVICPPSVAKYMSRRTAGLENSTEKSDSTPKSVLKKRVARRSSVIDPLQDVTPRSILGTHRRNTESLSRAVKIRNANGDVGKPLFETPRRGTPMSMHDMARASPGVFIPSMRELEVTGTELAEDMAGNLVAGIFSMSEPNLDIPKHLLEASEGSPGIGVQSLEGLGKQSVQDSIPNSPVVQESTVWYPLFEAGKPISLLFRFPDSCLYAKYSESKKHIALLLGCPIDKEPREILILSVFKSGDGEDSESGIKILQTIQVQKSKYFPVCIPYNVNFFTLCETKKGEPVLIMSSALEFTDVMTQAYQPCLHVIPCRKKSITSSIVSIENDQPITFVESLAGAPYSLVVSGQYVEDGIQIIEFDPMWQSFKWGKKYSTCLDRLVSVPTSHISKILSMEERISLVLASDSSSDDIVFSWKVAEPDVTCLQHIENAEIFSDGTSLAWFLRHKEKIKELSFAGDVLTASGDKESPEKKEIRSASVIFACDAYVALGDIYGDIQVWDVSRMLSKKLSLSSLSDANEKRINAIVQIHLGPEDKNGLCITSASGVCTIVSYDELFT